VFFGSLSSTNTFAGADAGAAGPTNCCNSFFGRDSGKSTTTGGGNSFFGNQAGRDNIGGGDNTFIGAFAGQKNTTGNANSFLGVSSGINNTTGSDNVFIGVHAGELNTTGNHNTFVGRHAGRANANNYNSFFGFNSGYSNTIGGENAFFGSGAGNSNTTGDSNSYFGAGAGGSNKTGNYNSAFGHSACGGFETNFGNSCFGRRSGKGVRGNRNTFIGHDTGSHSELIDLENATAIGANAHVTQSNSLVLGSIAGINLATATVSVGIGEHAPADRLQVRGDIRIGTSGTTGCLKNASGGVITGTCSSDLRFKHAVTPFTSTLEKLVQLKPVHFFWNTKQFPEKRFGEEQSYGLIAQEVEKVLPELVAEDEQGLKAVDYAKLPLLTLQAVKELKEQNDSLKERIEQQEKRDKQQQEQIDALKKLVCRQSPQDDVCNEEQQ
jgi:hypothetical protein